MEIIDFSKQNSIINKYMAEMRDKDYQSNRLLFRNNILTSSLKKYVFYN